MNRASLHLLGIEVARDDLQVLGQFLHGGMVAFSIVEISLYPLLVGSQRDPNKEIPEFGSRREPKVKISHSFGSRREP